MLPESSTTQEELTYSRESLAKALCISVATIDRLDASGKIPQAFRLGGRKLWAREVIRDWLTAGMPDRLTWQAMRPTNANTQGLRPWVRAN